MDGKDLRDPLIIEGNRLVKVIDMSDEAGIIVPEGVETVCKGAGYGSHAVRIVLPESLKRIESEAFGEMNWLEEPVHIPAGVEYIAVDAFSDPKNEPSLYFTADEKNPYYYAENGVLYEKKPPVPGLYDAQEVTPLTGPEALAGIKEWSIVTFGRFQQTEEGKDRSPVEWLVLKKEEDRALLLSRYALETMPYDERGFEGMDWKRCTMRKWLNMFFFNTAFSGEEQSMILPTAGRDGCEEEDRVFVPDRREAEDVFMNIHTQIPDYTEGMYRYEDSARCCRGTPYVLARGADTIGENGCVDWWCSDNDWRHGTTFGSYVDNEGGIKLLQAWQEGNCVRPALWVGTGK